VKMTLHIVVDCAFKVIPEAKVQEMMANGIDGFIIRGGYVTGVDPEVALQAPIFRKCNARWGIYRYWVTGYNAIQQGDALAKDGLTNNPDFLSGDAEERKEYYSWTQATPDFISVQYRSMVTEVKAKTNRPYVNYTGPWFTDAYSPQMMDWLKDSWMWGASYPHGWDKDTPDLWPKTYAELHAKANALQFPKDPRFPTWVAWQFGGDVIVKEIGFPLDFTIIDRDDIFNWMFKGGPMPVLSSTTPVPPVVVTPPDATNPGEMWHVTFGISCLTVRTGPGMSYPEAPFGEWLYGASGTHANADKVAIIEKSGNWGRFADHRWVNLGCMERV
jgi:hypothetical protein